MHPEKFSAFLDGARLLPNAGNKTPNHMPDSGGTAEQGEHSTSTVIDGTARYNHSGGWFAISAKLGAQRREFAIRYRFERLAGREAASHPSNQIAAAYRLCARPRQRH